MEWGTVFLPVRLSVFEVDRSFSQQSSLANRYCTICLTSLQCLISYRTNVDISCLGWKKVTFRFGVTLDYSIFHSLFFVSAATLKKVFNNIEKSQPPNQETSIIITFCEQFYWKRRRWFWFVVAKQRWFTEQPPRPHFLMKVNEGERTVAACCSSRWKCWLSCCEQCGWSDLRKIQLVMMIVRSIWWIFKRDLHLTKAVTCAQKK